MHRRNGRGRLLLVVFIALSVLIITLDFRPGPAGPLERVKDVSQAVVAPIQRGLTTVTRPIGNFFSSLGDLADLQQENEELEAEVAELRSGIDLAEGLADENAELKALLELDEPWFTMDSVAVQVQADAPGNYRWAVIIDKGSEDGIAEDMAVISADGLVGKVVSAEASQATVLLLIDPNAGAAAATDEEGVTGRVSGNGEGTPLSLDYIPKDAPISEGDRVVTSTYNKAIFPPGIPIGVVSVVGGDERAAQLEIFVEPFVDFTKLNVLRVLLETGAPVTLGDAEAEEDGA